MISIARRFLILVLSLALCYASLFGLYIYLNPRDAKPAEAREDAKWIATSQSWTDRTACKFVGVCGGNHWKSSTRWWRHQGGGKQDRLQQSHHHNEEWHDPQVQPSNWTKEERVLRDIPQYIFDYAPLVHLFSGEKYWPTDIADHLHHITPKRNYTVIEEYKLNLTHLANLNHWNKGKHVFLTSNDDPEQIPDWLSGEKNIPYRATEQDVREDAKKDLEWDGTVEGEALDDVARREGWYEVGDGNRHGVVKRGAMPLSEADASMNAFDVEAYHEAIQARDQHAWRHRRAGKSNAPAVLIVIDKGNGIVDAFWFYFYSFNLGTKVLKIRFGNHVGDWEHSMVRFQNGEPKAVFLSEHNFGGAYSYEAVEKIGKRPVIYAATGSHAMYATPGKHTYVLPFGLLQDITDRGPLWDPALNAHAYTYDYKTDVLRSSTTSPYSPTSWFYFAGHWGDKFYELGDKRQYRFAGQYHYVNGPLGPRFKNLGRKKICQGRDSDPCVIKNWLDGPTMAKRWVGIGEGEEWPEEE
ncbi:Vacuolar protein sorting-associated protein 62 [Xylographa bjoerkii]|nr:Vacuolar protein sorting-associated protein 62 [Xylographa bjoerkii]